MPKPDTKTFAEQMLNASAGLIYQQILPKTRPPTPAPRIDELGAGDFEFVGFHPDGSDPQHIHKPRGLFVRTRRPTGLPPFAPNGDGVTSTIAAFRVPAPGALKELPTEFVVTATFRKPEQSRFVDSAPHPIPPGDHPGEWAAVIVVFTANPARRFFAATAQFRDPAVVPSTEPPIGVRLNLPVTGFQANLPNIDEELFDRMKLEQKPSTFTLILHINRSSTPCKGSAMMFVDADNCYPTRPEPTVSFNFGPVLTPATVLEHIGAGIATADGSRFNASTEIHEFEIWAKT